jgi:hypothetical protein
MTVMGPSSEAAEAAAEAITRAQFGLTTPSRAAHDAHAALAAALPIIRREIAEEIEAQLAEYSSRDWGFGTEQWVGGVTQGMDVAARIVRGEVSR